MAHAVQVNNYIQKDGNFTLDPLSRTFITLQSIIGLNRFPLISNRKIISLLSTLYVLFLISFTTYLTAAFNSINEHIFVECIKLTQYILCCICACVSRRKIQCFYEELNKFDVEVGCKPKITRESVMILISMIGICIVLIVPVFSDTLILHFLPLHVVHIIETHYYALLFNLLNQRIHSMNRFIQSSLCSLGKRDGETDPKYENDSKKFPVKMTKLMDYYYILINAYDLLTEGIKWQLLFIITTSFLYTLIVSYHVALEVIYGYGEKSVAHIIVDVMLMASETIPLLAPSMCCDTLRQEVRRLRELLASKLFESKIEKSDRSVARALLALTKSRNLSFSLLRMLDISISLPFSFIGLLATYLIILLQFEKVINPNVGKLDNITPHV